MGSGSVGWVMHEYHVKEYPSLRMCAISFSGHGRKRKRIPDGYDDEAEPATQRPRVAASDTSGSSSDYASSQTTTTTTTTPFVDQEFDQAQQACGDQQEQFQHVSDHEEITEMVEEMMSGDDAQIYMVPTIEQQVDYQEPSTAKASEDEQIAAMLEEMTDTLPQPFLLPLMKEQQVDHQEPSMFDGTSYMDLPLRDDVTTPSSCCMPNASDMPAGTQGAITWEGFELCW